MGWNGKRNCHQIGTPLSSLMGWVTLLHDQGGNEEVVLKMNKDILRLQMITERFSKIGYNPNSKIKMLIQLFSVLLLYER